MPQIESHCKAIENGSLVVWVNFSWLKLEGFVYPASTAKQAKQKRQNSLNMENESISWFFGTRLSMS